MQIKKYLNKNTILSTFLVSFTIGLANAAPVTIPNTFSAGTPAVAAQVNGNFDAVKTAVDDNDNRVTTNTASIETTSLDIASFTATLNALQDRVTALETDTVALQADNAALETRVVTLEADNAALENLISNVVPYMTGGIDAQDQPTIFFSGVNVHVNHGGGTTDSVNGTGNLIIGYDEGELAGSDFCTVTNNGSAYTIQIDCEDNGGVWGSDPQKIGSHNLVIGYGHSYTQSGGLVAGYLNVIAGRNSSVSGGQRNNASGFASSVSGGSVNNASGRSSSVSGGWFNNASGSVSSVSGGRSNVASNNASSVSGGESNNASGEQSSVSGGISNVASVYLSSVSGGNSNVASGSGSTVSGGNSNVASGSGSTVSGGSNRTATGTSDWVAGSLFEDN